MKAVSRRKKAINIKKKKTMGGFRVVFVFTEIEQIVIFVEFVPPVAAARPIVRNAI